MKETDGLKMDPAIEHWGYMRNTTHAYYRFNYRKLIPTLLTVIIFPGLIYYGMIRGFVSFKSHKFRSKVKWKRQLPKDTPNQ